MQTAIEKSKVILDRIEKGDAVQAIENSRPVTLDLSRVARLVRGFGHEINALGSVIVRRGRLWFAVNLSAKGVVHVEAHYAERMEPIGRVLPIMLADLDSQEIDDASPKAWVGPVPPAPTSN